MSRKPPPPVAARRHYIHYRAICDYEGDSSIKDYDVLSFEEGQAIMYVKDLDEHWIVAKVNGKDGIVPRSCVDVNSTEIFPLHEACKRGSLEQVRESLKSKLPVNQGDKTKCTPIYWAARGGYNDCIQELLKTQHCNVIAANTVGDTALHIAAQKGYLSTCELLYQQNAEIIGIKNKHGQTARDVAMPTVMGFFKSKMGEYTNVVVENSDNEDSDED